MKTIKKWAFALITAAVVASLLGAILIPMAAAERGCTGAVGGEWLAIVLTWIGTLWLMTGEEKA